ncbi:ATP-dependent DNA ligase [Mangrovivirga sp. M17]|uniref:DNA ligase (ATP) n=1 Tax=Mangrovivirga halotolerans TaxID=2993936 RepID=A0ABT3RN33_9BACT|nr:ATP-dependent DNA ligase [Mangrovivirga halotolerans]MCX2743179.1 ATP-dependent DNA ligase [Mangrovivirga halotolerans]
MKHFISLFKKIDSTTKTSVKQAALVEYLQKSDGRDSIWAVALLTGKRPKRTVNSTQIRTWAAEESGIPLWLFEDTYHIVGDLAETVSLVLPPVEKENLKPLSEYMDLLTGLKDKEEEEKKELVLSIWRSLDVTGRFIFNKLMTGGFRIGVSSKIMTKAIADYAELPEDVVALRLTGRWSPVDLTLDDLLKEPDEEERLSKPYPFYLAYALEDEPHELGDPDEWFAERKWDGIRGQIILRDGQLFVWSRGEELITDKYPEFEILKDLFDHDIVFDGEILAFSEGEPLPFHLLQQRIGRKNVTASLMKKVPVAFYAYDILEYKEEDFREVPFSKRRALLEKVLSEIDSEIINLSPIVSFSNWKELEPERENALEYKSEGLMLKHKDSIYQVGRKKGGWWKWKMDPLTVDAVLIYAMRGHGRRANLYTDYTFAVWDDEGNLVPFTKAYSGLTDAEFMEVDRFVKQNTIERFGPVRSVTPELVFEIAFEGIAPSKRHKSGVAVRFPRMHRWRKDKPVEEADTLANLHKILNIVT